MADKCARCGGKPFRKCGVCEEELCWMCYGDSDDDWCGDCKCRYEDFMAEEWEIDRKRSGGM